MSASRSKLRALVLIAASIGVCGVGACSQPEPRCEVRVAAAQLSNGTARSEYLRLEPQQENAVVQVLAAGVALCSGVLVAERVVLTAQHCTAASSAQAFEVAFGAAPDAIAFMTAARVLAADEVADVAALELAESPDGASEVQPLPVAERLPSGFARDSLVQISGFGFDARTFGRRAFLVERVAELADDHVIVSAGGLAGACFGDSGGPLLVRGDDGRAQTLGLLGQGSGDCRGSDRYRRVDTLADWLAREAGVTAPDPADPDGERLAYPALGNEGRCFGALAAWYAGGELHGEICDGGLRCGWDREAAGQRCIRSAADACDGVDDLGACIDGNAVRCVRGAPTRNPCSPCGFDCERSPKTGLPVCLDLPGGRDGG